MSSFEDSKKIIDNSFDYNRSWKVCFEYKRDYNKMPLSLEEQGKLTDDLIQVFEKYNMDWKML